MNFYNHQNTIKMATKETVFKKDEANKKIFVTRNFDAPIDAVWKAWTTAELLDKWWAPKPYRAETKTMDFREGGMWLYCMVGPEGDRHWGRVDYLAIEKHVSISAKPGFCDEDGNMDPEAPRSNWLKQFSESEGTTTVNIEITYNKIEDMKRILEMGFEGGFKLGLGNLDELLAAS